jgi:Uma2 family endonuclease
MSVDERPAAGAARRRILCRMDAAEHLDIDALLPLSLENYHRLVEAGGFEGERVELLDGLLVRMSPKSERHEAVVEFLNDWLGAAVDRRRYIVGASAP